MEKPYGSGKRKNENEIRNMKYVYPEGEKPISFSPSTAGNGFVIFGEVPKYNLFGSSSPNPNRVLNLNLRN